MGKTDVAVGSKALDDFCQFLRNEFKTPQIVWPETIANKFTNFFKLEASLFLNKYDLLHFCESIGVGYPQEMYLPENIRGLHFGVGGDFEIGYREGDWDGGIRHTILHEIYEIIIHILDDIGKLVRVGSSAMEDNANMFSAAVLMPRQQFFEHSVRFSFDPLLLMDRYQTSYYSILRRMRDVLAEHTSFVGILYDRPYRMPGDFKTKYAICTSDFKQPGSVFPLPKSDEHCWHGNPFHEIVLKSAKALDGYRNVRIPYSLSLDDKCQSMICGSYPVFSPADTTYKILITTIYEDHWPKLRANVSKMNREEIIMQTKNLGR